MASAESDGWLPNLIVIGAQKCGTTSLHSYLDLHPEISMSRDKETDFFLWHQERGAEWWRTQFRPRARIRGESSTGYTTYPLAPWVPERIAAAQPEARLIYLVRDPVDRLVSAYVHLVASGRTERSPEEVFTHPDLGESDLVYRGLYAMQLERYLEHFDLEQILVLEHRDLLEHRDRTLRRAFRHLGVDEDFRASEFAVEHNPTSALRRGVGPARGRSPFELGERLGRLPRPIRGAARRLLTRPAPRPAIDPKLRRELGSYFEEDAARLRDLTGLALEHWSV
jgi:Sulfotransferase domain